jgi:hypothetical protein
MMHPRLQEGRSYAMMVTASDPSGNATFRNHGRSEVIRFSYSHAELNSENDTDFVSPKTEYATNIVRGRLVWTFKKSERAEQSLYLGGVSIDEKQISNAQFSTTAITPYTGKGFTAQSSLTPLIKFNALTAINTDPTLQNSTKAPSGYHKITVSNAVSQTQPTLAQNLVFASHSSSTESKFEYVQVDSAKDRHPLAHAKFTLTATNNGYSNLLATGQTDGQGRFTIELLHPSYSENNSGGVLILSVQTSDFENTSFKIPASSLRDEAVDLGSFLLLAKTYRFIPKVTFPESDDAATGNYTIRIYRDASEAEERPWIIYEGHGKGNNTMQVVDGRQVIEVASREIKSTPKKAISSSIIATLATFHADGVGRIFLGGSLYVKIIPESNGFYPITSTVSVFNAVVPANQVLQAKAIYKLSRKPPHISGEVKVWLDERGGVPVAGATVRIQYKKADVIPGSQSVIGSYSQGELTLKGNQYLSTWGKYDASSPASTSFQSIAYAVQDMSHIPAVMIQQSSGKSTLSAQFVSPVSAVFANTYDPVPEDSKAITVTTNELGVYYAGNLPRLQAGKSFIVEVINVPHEFRTFPIRPLASVPYPVEVTLGTGKEDPISFRIDADVADVVGRVVDASGNALANTRILYKGTILTQTGPDGLFQFKIFPGNHNLSLEKEGYVVGKAVIHIPQLTGNDSQESAYKTQWSTMTPVQKHQATLTRIGESPTVKASVARGNPFSPAMFGIASNDNNAFTSVTEFNASLAVAFNLPVNPGTPHYEMPRRFAVDVKDIGYLNKISGKVTFRLHETGSEAIRIAGASIHLFDTTNVTDANGEWYYEGFGGTTTVTVVPPASSPYVAIQKIFTLPETGVNTIVNIPIQRGVIVSGRVTSAGMALPDATILIDDNEILKFKTDENGYYQLVTTPGEHKISATKGNYVGKNETQIIASTGAVINFELQGNNGKNYSTLLGFAIELSAVNKLSNGQEKWSGAFVNLKSINANVFETARELRIPFNGVTVSFDANGNAIPAGNTVKTDFTNLSLKLFGFLPAKVQSADGITFTRAADGSGQLAGSIQADFKSLQGYRGWSINEDVPLYLTDTNATTPGKVVVFSSSSNSEAASGYKLLSTSSSQATGNLYGFSVSVANGGVIDNTGIELSGSITTPAVGPVRAVTFNIERLFLNKALAISSVQIKAADAQALEIASWKGVVHNIIFNEDGFKVGGDLSIEIPRSGKSQVSFSDLAIASNGVFGGSFLIPESGIDLLAVADLNADGTPLSFGRVGNSSVYRIGGKANLKINVDIMDKVFEVPSFEVMTNGDFAVQVPANYSTSLGPFGFSVSNIYIDTKGNSPFIGVQGNFRTDFHFLRLEMADIKIRSSASGPHYVVEKLGVKVDVPVVKTEAFVTFTKDGFSGSGSLSVPGTPIHGNANFKYFRRGTGIELGASFFANTPPVPIGVLVTLDGVGGGFEYKSGGANGGFAVDVRGKLSFLGTGAAVAVNPLGLTVSSAGVLKGYGDVEVGSYLKTGKAEVVFNGPDRTFHIQVGADMAPLEGLASQSIKGALVISAKPNDEFAFLGCAVHIKLLGLIDNHGELALAVGLENPRTRGDLVAEYFRYAPEQFINDRFSGVYLNVDAQLGIPLERPLEFDLYALSAKLWCSTQFRANLILNFAEMAYRMQFGGQFNAGLRACVIEACAGFSGGLCYIVEGSRNDSQGWFFGATASGQVSFEAGIGVGDCSPGCNEIETIPDGCIGGAFKICGAASLEFGFSQRDGVKFIPRAGSSGQPCF